MAHPFFSDGSYKRVNASIETDYELFRADDEGSFTIDIRKDTIVLIPIEGKKHAFTYSPYRAIE